MRKMAANGIITLASAVILMTFGLFGCSHLPNQPETTPRFTIADFEAATRGDNAGFIQFNQNQTSELVNSSDGDTIEFNINRTETGTFEIAQNSIDSNTLISIEVKEIYIHDKTILEFKFGPSGLVFSPDAKLILSVDAFDDPDMDYLDWYYYNPATESYQLKNKIFVVDGHIVIPIAHFSDYLGISQGGQ